MGSSQGEPRFGPASGNDPKLKDRFGQYATHELDTEPEAYEPHLDVDFTKLGEADTEQAA
jgi:hypothetical protein